ncbi:MAG: DNA repair protein RadC [Rhodospirillales bacterium]|jgi:DNA repair protein RadC|nr:DNA repair protein RadC [Rhodospirillales bacterium]
MSNAPSDDELNAASSCGVTGPDYSLPQSAAEDAPHSAPVRISGERIEEAAWNALVSKSGLSGMSDAGQLAFSIDPRTATSRFSFTLGQRRTRRNDLWYRFLSLAANGQTMADVDFVEMVLYTTGRIKDCRALAKKLLDRFQTVAGVFNAELHQLADLGPIDRDIFNAFRAVRGVAGHLARQEIAEKPVITNWDKLIVYLRATMAHKTVEQFRALFLDRRNVLLADEMQSEGTIDHTPVYPREIVKRALILEASAVLIVHNHPSNHLTPSRADIEMTTRIKTALDSVNVVLHDHVIVSKSGHTSFRILGLL